MITSNLKDITVKYQSVSLVFTYAGNRWNIVVNNRCSNLDDEALLTEDNDDMYTLLQDLLPGDNVYNYQDEIIGSRDGCCYKYVVQENKVMLYSGSLTNEGLSVIEKEFDSELDFYIYLFQNFSAVSLSASLLKELGLKTPFQIVVEFITSEGFLVIGIKDGVIDYDGYSHSAMVLKNIDGKYLTVQYPQKDSFIYTENLIQIEKVEPLSFNKEFLEILLDVKNNRINNYFERYLWD